LRFIKERFPTNHTDYPPVILAYYAALEGLRGRHASNPWTKFTQVSKAIPMMNEAVERAPGLLEARFLRFSFFHQVPGIFGVGGKVDGDLGETIALMERRDYSFASAELQKDMIAYLLGTERLTQARRRRLERLARELEESH
jgi:hypothetical protein